MWKTLGNACHFLIASVWSVLLSAIIDTFSFVEYCDDYFGQEERPDKFSLSCLREIVDCVLIHAIIPLTLYLDPRQAISCLQLVEMHYNIGINSDYLWDWETAVAQCLRWCATNRKVAGSIPDSFIGIFHWHNPSDRTMALGSIQPLTEMSTRRIS